MLGPFELCSASAGRIDVGGKKLKGLVAYLAMRSPRGEHRERVMSLLWGSHFDQQARQNLRQALVRLRRSLGDVVASNDDEHIGLSADGIETDVRRFEAAATDASLAGLEVAEQLYAGPFLQHGEVGEEGFDEWLASERRRLEAVAADVLARLSQLRLDRGDHVGAQDTARRAIALAPLKEDAHRTLMTALAASGERAEALRHYAGLEQVLHRELQALPEHATTSLVERLRVEDWPPPRAGQRAMPLSASAVSAPVDQRSPAPPVVDAANQPSPGPAEPAQPSLPVGASRSPRWRLRRDVLLASSVSLAVGAAAGSVATMFVSQGGTPQAVAPVARTLGGPELEAAVARMNFEGVGTQSGDPYTLRFELGGKVQGEVHSVSAEFGITQRHAEAGRWWVEQNVLNLQFTRFAQGRHMRRHIIFDGTGYSISGAAGSRPAETGYVRSGGTKWGALAVTPFNSWGRAHGWDSRDGAEAFARAKCEGIKSGTCDKLSSFSGEECAVLAGRDVDGKIIGKVSVHANFVAARTHALSICQAEAGVACRVVATVCADGRHRQPP
jgi:DNA-binding SARP family transcriptional activator